MDNITVSVHPLLAGFVAGFAAFGIYRLSQEAVARVKNKFGL